MVIIYIPNQISQSVIAELGVLGELNEPELASSAIHKSSIAWIADENKVGGYYDRQIDSEVADMINTGKTRNGGATAAAQFLQRFINEHSKWAHIDIAATAYVAQDGFMTNKNATGFFLGGVGC